VVDLAAAESFRLRRKQKIELWLAGEQTRAPLVSSAVDYLIGALEIYGMFIGMFGCAAIYGVLCWRAGRMPELGTLVPVLTGGTIVGLFVSWGIVEVLSGCARRMKRNEQKE
jgi:hypothetical protein